MISEKNDEKLLSFSDRAKDELEKFNWFFIDFLRYSFGREKVISTVIEREYTPDKIWWIYFAYQLTGFYMIKGFTERYFLTDYSYILENHIYFVNPPDYWLLTLYPECFALIAPWRYCLLNTKVIYYTYISHIITLQVHYLQKERNRFHSEILL